MSNEQLHSYSSKLMPQIPIKYLLHQCQKQQQNYTGLYPALLRLLATHYPHLCLVEEWLGEEMEEEEGGGWRARERCKVKCTPERLQTSRCFHGVYAHIKVLLIGLFHLKSIHPLCKILEKCTTEGVWIWYPWGVHVIPMWCTCDIHVVCMWYPGDWVKGYSI